MKRVISLVFLSVLLSLALVGVANAQGSRPPQKPEQPDEVLGERIHREVSNDALPFTGADVTSFVVIGSLMIGTGMLVIRRLRSTDQL